VPEPTEIELDLQRLEAELKRLEAEYTMYFSGRLPKPPFETRGRVEALVKQYDRTYIQNYGDRFRFSTLQARFSKLVDLWDRGLRAREEGRSGPFAAKRDAPPPPAPAVRAAPKDREVYATTMRDPVREMDRMEHLYESLTEARRANGQDAVPFHKFAELVKNQVDKLRQNGGREVAFRIALKDGKVSFTAKALKKEPT
jgi:hypothetical protein